MKPDEIRELFPELEPVRSPPSMFLVNGCGLSVFGERDRDPRTHTFVKTHCFALLWIPVLALAAYRVAPAGGRRWYFLGKVPLSAFARNARLVTLAAVVAIPALSYWGSWARSPERLAAQQVERGEELAASGDLAGAVAAYRDARLHAPDEANAALEALVAGPLATAPLPKAAAAVASLAACADGDPAAYLHERGVARLTQRVVDEQTKDPVGALALLDALRPPGSDPASTRDLESRLLETIVAATPDDVPAVSRLACLLEARGELERCVTLLSPLSSRLADSEGARILGQARARKGDLEGSFRLLAPYFQRRLGAYHSAERDFEQAYESVQQTSVAALERGEAGDAFYRAYDRADATGKAKLVWDFVRERALLDPGIRRRRDALAKAGEVVGAAIDLGMVRLERAQGMTDPSQRRRELEEAERVFLAVSGAASESDGYRILLGQVKYWLGKPDEGKRLFVAYLDSKVRSPAALLEIATVLRKLGALSEARTMAEDAYERASDVREKQAAASLRANLETDEDDGILWQGRGDLSDPVAAASLAELKGRKALRLGDDATAAARLREALAAYDRLPESSTTANNRAVTLDLLYRATGDVAHLGTARELLERAERLAPSDSILIWNAGAFALMTAIADLVKDTLDLATLRSYPDVGLLAYLWHDEASRHALEARVRAHPGVRRALEKFEKVVVLAPRGSTAYVAQLGVFGVLHDGAGLEAMKRRLATVDLDTEGDLAAALDAYAGADATTMLAKARGQRDRAARLLEAARHAGAVGPTIAAACVALTDADVSLAALGKPGDADAIVTLAEEAVRAHDCDATRTSRLGALLHRGARRVEVAAPAFADLRRRSLRMLSDMATVALGMETGGDAVRAALASDPDVKRAVAELLALSAADPAWIGPEGWALVRGVDRAAAATLAPKFLASSAGVVTADVAHLVAPMSVEAAYTRHWALLLAGDDAGARDVLDRTERLGIALPAR